MNMTIAEFAKVHGITNHVANGLVAFLVAKGSVTKTDENRAVLDAEGKPKRGRPSAVYEFPESVTLNLTTV